MIYKKWEKKSLNLLSGSDTTATTHKHGSISHHSNNNVNGTEARSAPAALSLSSLCVFWEITFELFFFFSLTFLSFIYRRGIPLRPVLERYENDFRLTLIGAEPQTSTAICIPLSGSNQTIHNKKKREKTGEDLHKSIERALNPVGF